MKPSIFQVDSICKHFVLYKTAAGYANEPHRFTGTIGTGGKELTVTDKNCFLRIEQFASVAPSEEMKVDLEKGPPCEQIPTVWTLTIRQDGEALECDNGRTVLQSSAAVPRSSLPFLACRAVECAPLYSVQCSFLAQGDIFNGHFLE